LQSQDESEPPQRPCCAADPFRVACDVRHEWRYAWRFAAPRKRVLLRFNASAFRSGSSSSDPADRLDAIERMLGIGADGSDASAESGSQGGLTDRLAALEQHLGIGAADGSGVPRDDKLAALERRVTSLEDGRASGGEGGADPSAVESKSSDDGADGSAADEIVVDGADGADGSGADGAGADGSGADGSGDDGSVSVNDQLAELRKQLTELSSGQSGDGADAVGELQRRATEAEGRLDDLERAAQRAQQSADEARMAAAAATEQSRRASAGHEGDDDKDADDGSGLHDAVRSLGQRAESMADEDIEKGSGASVGSVGRLRSRGSRGSGMRALSRPVSPLRSTTGSDGRPLTAGSQRAGAASPDPTAMPIIGGAGVSQADAEAMRSDLSSLQSDLDSLRAEVAANTEALRRAKEEAEAASEAAAQRAATLAERRKEAGGDALGGATAEELTAALAAVDEVSSTQRRMQGELERLGKAAARAAETADEAVAAARAAKRSAAANAISDVGGHGDGESKTDGGGQRGAGGGTDAATARAIAASATASLSSLTGLARASAGVAGVSPDRVDELAGPADAAVDALRMAVSRLEKQGGGGGSGEASGQGGGGGDGGSDASRAALEAVGTASAEVSAALDRLMEETAPHAQCKASQSDVAALRGMVGHVEAELGRAHGSVRDLRSRTEEQLSAMLTNGGAGGGSGMGGGGGGGRGGRGSPDDEVSDEELAALWEALAQKADVSEVRGLAPIDALRTKADRRELLRLKSLLDKLWRHVEAQGSGAPATGDFAFLSGKPLKDYKCLSCGTKLDGMVEPPKFHLPTSAMPPSTTRRRSPQPPSRASSPGQPGQSVVLPNGTVVHRPVGVSGALAASGGPMAARLSDNGERRVPSAGARRPGSSTRRAVRRQSEAASAGGGKLEGDTSLPPIA